MKRSFRTTWPVIVVVLVQVLPAFGYLDFADGGTHTIDYMILTEDVRIGDGPQGVGTTVNLTGDGNVFGGTVYASGHCIVNGSRGGHAWKIVLADSTTVNLLENSSAGTCTAAGNSTVNILGGYANTVTLGDQAMLSTRGGTITSLYTSGASSTLLAPDWAGNVYASGRSSVVITEGIIDQEIRVSEWSYLSVSGGSLTEGGGGNMTIVAEDHSHVDISGGELHGGVATHGNAVITLTGGVIGGSSISSVWRDGLLATESGILSILGGAVFGDLTLRDEAEAFIRGGVFGGDLIATGSTQITIYGTGFNYGLGEIGAPVGVLTGTLANGDLLHNRFYLYDDASIVLIPEPCSVLLLGAGALLLHGKKRRKV